MASTISQCCRPPRASTGNRTVHYGMSCSDHVDHRNALRQGLREDSSPSRVPAADVMLTRRLSALSRSTSNLASEGCPPRNTPQNAPPRQFAYSTLCLDECRARWEQWPSMAIRMWTSRMPQKSATGPACFTAIHAVLVVSLS